MDDKQASLKQLLRQAPLTSSLADDELETLAKLLVIKNYKEGTVIYRVGEHIKQLNLIMEGKIRFDLGFIEGQSNHLGIIGRGEHFGDLEILTRQPSVANAHAIEACKIALMPAETFLNLFQSNPHFAQMLALKFAILFRLTQQILAISISETADKKLALLLLSLNAQLGSGPEHERVINLQLAQEELANMLGVTRQAISKPLNEWKHNGWISIRNRIITLHQMEPLKALASFDLALPRFAELNTHPSAK